MLNPSLRSNHRLPLRQNGIVLLIALIMLVAMTLAGLALVRSVHTSTAIAGNLAFQQAATNSGDSGIDAAVRWLELNNGTGVLYNNSAANGYTAFKTAADDPQINQTWDNLWTNIWTPNGAIITLPIDTAGNTVAYTIQRLCSGAGDPLSIAIDCSVSPIIGAVQGNSAGTGVVTLKVSNQVYYRITVRVSGPRNTVSYIQSTVAL